MSHYAPSTFVVERSLLYATGVHTMVCLCCGDTMKHCRTIATLGVRPEQHIFVCPSCNGVDSKEIRRVA
jgi:bacterioferritin-associated ferredoxin